MRQTSSGTFGPKPFRDYLEENNLSHRSTASAISVDNISRLARDLAEAEVMVFRLGSNPGRNITSFALAKCRKGLGDFFLQDAVLFDSVTVEEFSAAASRLDFAAFKYLPRLTESSVVNLALASGILGEALNLDDPRCPIIPATAQSTFTFDVKAHEDTPAWSHQRGQIEIDSVFFSKRNGIKTLFAVEAKQSDNFCSLAKHKLVYPTVALRSVPLEPQATVVPVYLRALRQGNAWVFYVCECSLPASAPAAISSLSATGNRRAFRLQL
jgi:hypothetical protein